MGFYYEKVLRPILFRSDAEKAHEMGVQALATLGRIRPLCRMMERFNVEPASVSPVELFGVKFPNPVGLAAGMDKDARIWRSMRALGFGFTELGTVTFHKQPGNDKPRLFRLPPQQAVINRMGFNNDGAEEVAARLKQEGAHQNRPLPIGINIGKSKVTPLSDAASDYIGSFQLLADYADYFTINVSSPNTPELRKLQGSAYLPELLKEITKANTARAKKLGGPLKPILLKIAPDLSYREIDGILQAISDTSLSGIIATNTTLARPGSTSKAKEDGGLSGRPLHMRSVQVVNYISRATQGKLPIIGVGGIDDPESAGRMVDAGAHLIQVYTGLIYRGPLLPKKLNRALAEHQRHWV